MRTFLDFTQPLKVQREEVDLCELARTVVEVVRPEAANRGVALVFQGGRVTTLGDRDLLYQASMNIVVNAVEATPSGGEVVVDASESDRQCRLRITDTGPGIPDTTRKKISNCTSRPNQAAPASAWPWRIAVFNCMVGTYWLLPKLETERRSRWFCRHYKRRQSPSA